MNDGSSFGSGANDAVDVDAMAHPEPSAAMPCAEPMFVLVQRREPSASMFLTGIECGLALVLLIWLATARD